MKKKGSLGTFVKLFILSKMERENHTARDNVDLINSVSRDREKEVGTVVLMERKAITVQSAVSSFPYGASAKLVTEEPHHKSNLTSFH